MIAIPRTNVEWSCVIVREIAIIAMAMAGQVATASADRHDAIRVYTPAASSYQVGGMTGP